MGARRNCFNDPRRRNPPRSPGVIASPFQDQQHHQYQHHQYQHHHEQLQLPLPSPSEVYYHGQVNGLSLQRPLPQWPNPAQDMLMTEPVDLVGQIVADIFSERQIEERMIDRDGDVDAAGLGEAADDMYLEAKAKLLFYCNTIGVDLDAIALPSELRQSLSQRLRQAEEHEAEVAHGQPATVPSPQPEPEPKPKPNPEPRRPQPTPPAFLLPMPSKPLPVSDVSHAKQQQQQQQEQKSQQQKQQQRQPAPTTTTKSGGTGKTTPGQTAATTTMTMNKPKADPNKGMARAKTSAGGMIQNSTRPQRSPPPPTSKPPAPAHVSAPAPPPTPVLVRVPARVPAPAPAPAPTPKTTAPKPAETTTTLDADGDSEMGNASEPPFPAATTIARALSPHLPPPVMIELDNDVHMSNSSATTHPFLPHLGLDPRCAVNAALRMVRNCGDWCAWLRTELELALEQVLRQRQRASHYYYY